MPDPAAEHGQWAAGRGQQPGRTARCRPRGRDLRLPPHPHPFPGPCAPASQAVLSERRA